MPFGSRLMIRSFQSRQVVRKRTNGTKSWKRRSSAAFGQVPRWLADRMTRLGVVMSEAIVHQYGRDELLRRLAHPFWFNPLAR
jgi:Protein of unknown function (DUF763)